jgi:APA family basic amino acid/polyamine antiporter
VVACFVSGGHSGLSATATAASIASVTGGAGVVTPGSVPLPVLSSGWPLVVSIMLGLQAVFFTMDGWDGVIYFGEEVRDPGRDVPRAIFGSVFSIMLIYLMLNAAVLYVLPMSEICGNKFALGTATERIFGQYGDPVIRSIMVISLLSCINAIQLFCSRVLYAMSSDGLFFQQFSRVNKGGTPVMALLLSTVVAVFFVLGSFERVIAMLSFFFVANYTLSYTSLFILRRKEPGMVRPYLAWGYPWTPGIALAGSVLFLVGSIFTDRENAPLALAMLIASYPIFRILKFVLRRAAPKAGSGQTIDNIR